MDYQLTCKATETEENKCQQMKSRDLRKSKLNESKKLFRLVKVELVYEHLKKFLIFDLVI